MLLLCLVCQPITHLHIGTTADISHPCSGCLPSLGPVLSFITGKIIALHNRMSRHKKGRELLMDMLPHHGTTKKSVVLAPTLDRSEESTRDVERQTLYRAYDPQIKEMEAGQAIMPEMEAAESRQSVAEMQG